MLADHAGSLESMKSQAIGRYPLLHGPEI